MGSQNHQKMKDKVGEDHQPAGRGGGGGGGQQARQQILQPSSTASPPPSTSSSPTHEFSFTISFHQPPTTVPDKAKAPPPSIAVDLSPADEIFFHGHLLPLHLLSHLPVSPRSSTNSVDSFTLPITELAQDQNPNKTKSNTNANNRSIYNETKEKLKPKSKSFSLFGQSRRREGFEVRDQNEEKEKRKRKLRLDLSHVVKRYMRMFRPLLSFRWRRKNNIQLRRQPYSFSGNLSSPRGKKDLRGRRGEFSAPASMRTSPTDSGHLLPTGIVPNSNSSTSESTMEELQAAIQAAIAHCKNSIATEETKIKPSY